MLKGRLFCCCYRRSFSSHLLFPPSASLLNGCACGGRVGQGSTGTEKGVKDDDQVRGGNDGNKGGVPSSAASTTAGRPKLTDMLVKTLSSSKKSIESPGPSGGTPSAHGSVVGSGSGHGSSGHGRSWHGQGSGHGQGSSRHGSELPPRCIPEESKLSESGGVPPAEEGSSMLAGFMKMGREPFGSEHGSVASSYGGAEGGKEAMPPPRRPPLSKKASTGSVGGRGVEPTYPSEEEGGTSTGSLGEGFMKTLGRAISSISLGSNGSGHGSVQGSTHGSVQGSVHGSIQGSAHSSGGGGAVAGGAVVGSRRPSGLLPWSQLDDGEAAEVDIARNEYGLGTPRNLSSAANLGTPRATSTASLAPPRSHRALTGDGFRRRWRSLSGVTASTPRALSSAAVGYSRIFFGVGGSGNDGSSSSRLVDSGEVPFQPPRTRAAGYEAAMTNWPAGKVPGNPAWEEWSVEKKLFAHIVTASCLALIIATW